MRKIAIWLDDNIEVNVENHLKKCKNKHMAMYIEDEDFKQKLRKEMINTLMNEAEKITRKKSIKIR